MLRKLPLIFIVLALVLGGAAAWGAHQWLNARAKQAAAARLDMVPVVVAASDISGAQELRLSDMKIQRWPKNHLPQGYVTKTSVLKGRVLKTPVFKGEVILASKLAPKGLAGGLSALVPEGMRAMTVKVDDVIGVGGFVQPGDRVDVLATLSKGPYKEDPVTRTVLQDIKVLTVGGKVKDSKSKGAKRRRVSVVTLEVTPPQSETLALAVGQGKLLLSLRNRADNRQEGAGGVRLSAMVPTTADEIEEKAQAAEDKKVEIIVGVLSNKTRKKEVVKIGLHRVMQSLNPDSEEQEEPNKKGFKNSVNVGG